jgi:Domain of unknown function (DUF4861)
VERLGVPALKADSMAIRLVLVALLTVSTSLCFAAEPLSFKAVNKLQMTRASETIELSAKDLAALGEGDLTKIHIMDSEGKELLAQAVDSDYDELRKPDAVIFQADFAPGETRTFTAMIGKRHEYTKADFRAHGRFVRERFDDFAWENDRIAHRTYGKALETWKGEPLTSSTIDIWSKRTPGMVIDEWYMVDNYHADAGEGADFYSAGASRGDGGSGLWAADRLWVSSNFVDSRVLANGPIRVMFELVYDAFDVNGTKVSEVKRITLDAGSQFDHFQSFYKSQPDTALTTGIGLKKVVGEITQFNAAHGWLATWEPVEKNAGKQGLAIIVDPQLLQKQTEDQRNLLLLAKAPGNITSYWAGFAWDKAGAFTTPETWMSHVDEFSRRLRSPIEVRIPVQ